AKATRTGGETGRPAPSRRAPNDLARPAMRTLGPGSVSSFLKIILDVVYVALAISVVLIRAGAVGGNLTGPEIAAELLGAGLYAGGVLVICGELRRIFATLTAGDPFHPANVRRLRVIGLVLAALGILEMARYPITMLDSKFSAAHEVHQGGLNVTTWFAVLVVF